MRSGDIKKALSTLFYARFLVLSLALGLVSQPAFSRSELSMPSWADLFKQNRTHKGHLDESGMYSRSSNGSTAYLENGEFEAVFIEDNISDGIATDMSVRIGSDTLGDDLVYNDTVSALHDLGNAYVVASMDPYGDLQLYAGVELLSPLGYSEAPDSYVELEFTQGFVQATAVNAPLKGQRTDGDLLVRVNFAGGEASSAAIHYWTTGVGYQVIETVAISTEGLSNCQGGAMPYVFCSGTPPIRMLSNDSEVWDLDGNPLPVTEPDRFLQVGLDVAALLGTNPDFSSILLRTHEDISIDSFRSLGHWGEVNARQQGEGRHYPSEAIK